MCVASSSELSLSGSSRRAQTGSRDIPRTDGTCNPPPVCSGSASGLLSVGAVPRKPLEGEHLEPPRPTRSDGNERRFRSELLTRNLRQIRVIFEIFDVKKLANFKGNNSISYCRFKKGESSNKLYIFFSPTDSMTSEQRQKLAKERREERARYIGEK